MFRNKIQLREHIIFQMFTNNHKLNCTLHSQIYVITNEGREGNMMYIWSCHFANQLYTDDAFSCQHFRKNTNTLFLGACSSVLSMWNRCKVVRHNITNTMQPMFFHGKCIALGVITMKVIRYTRRQIFYNYPNLYSKIQTYTKLKQHIFLESTGWSHYRTNKFIRDQTINYTEQIIF